MTRTAKLATGLLVLIGLLLFIVFQSNGEECNSAVSVNHWRIPLSTFAPIPMAIQTIHPSPPPPPSASLTLGWT